MSKNIKQYIITSIIVMSIINSIYIPVAFAGPQSTTYEIKAYEFGSGGIAGNTSTTYSLEGISGQIDSNNITSTTYSLGPGLLVLQTSNVPPAPAVSNNSGTYYNKLTIAVNTGSNPSDTKYAIAVSPDNFTSTTKYIQADNTLGSNPVWQTNTLWGASGFTIIGLTPNTTYSVKVAAMQGNFTQSAYGPVTSATTAGASLSFSLSPNSVNIGQLTPQNVITAGTTVTVNLSTNSTGGGVVYIYDTNSGLLSSSVSNTISALSGDLNSASQGYGLRGTTVNQTAGGPMEIISPYNGAGTMVGLLDVTRRPIFDSSGQAITAGQGTFEVKAKASQSTKAASDYADTITVVASGTF